MQTILEVLSQRRGSPNRLALMPSSTSAEKYGEVLGLQQTLNIRFKTAFEENSHRTRAELATVLIQIAEDIVDELNSGDFHFGRAVYGGDTEFERSTQVFSDGEEMGTSVILSLWDSRCR